MSTTPQRGPSELKSPAQVCPLCSGTGYRKVEGANRVTRCHHGQEPPPVPGAARVRDLVAKLIESGCSLAGIQFDEQERAVVRALREAVGQSQAVAIKEISKETELDDRSIKGVVNRLRVQHRLKIGSSRLYKAKLSPVTSHESQVTVSHYGYYWITTRQELADTVGPYVRQAFSEIRVADALTDGRAGYRKALAELEGQIRLDFPEETK